MRIEDDAWSIPALRLPSGISPPEGCFMPQGGIFRSAELFPLNSNYSKSRQYLVRVSPVPWRSVGKKKRLLYPEPPLPLNDATSAPPQALWLSTRPNTRYGHRTLRNRTLGALNAKCQKLSVVRRIGGNWWLGANCGVANCFQSYLLRRT